MGRTFHRGLRQPTAAAGLANSGLTAPGSAGRHPHRGLRCVAAVLDGARIRQGHA